MIKNKILVLVLSLSILGGCSSLPLFNNLPSFNKQTPPSVQEAISSRINPENELYSLGVASLTKSGSIVAQSRANKDASHELKSKVKKEVETLYNSYLLNMDSYSKSIVSPVISDLTSYSTDLAMKKVFQKGAWEDSDKVYSLLVANRNDINSISQKVLKNFIDNASRRLESVSSSIK